MRDDDRPVGWGVCVVCGEDCEEQDYNEQMCTSTHRDCLDPNLWCIKHGKELPMGPYGHRYGGCEDCEPPEPDGEAFRGGEAAAYEAEQMARIQRTLK